MHLSSIMSTLIVTVNCCQVSYLVVRVVEGSVGGWQAPHSQQSSRLHLLEQLNRVLACAAGESLRQVIKKISVDKIIWKKNFSSDTCNSYLSLI